jgi:hypothetical protein
MSAKIFSFLGMRNGVTFPEKSVAQIEVTRIKKGWRFRTSLFRSNYG